MYNARRPIIGYYDNRENGKNSAGINEIFCDILGVNVIETINIEKYNSNVDYDSIIYWGPFRTIFDESNVLSAYKNTPGFIISLSEEEKQKWLGYLSNRPHYEVIEDVEEAYKLFVQEGPIVKNYFSQPFGTRLRLKSLRDGIISSLERRCKQLSSLWFSPRYEIQKIVLNAFVSLIEQFSIKLNNNMIHSYKNGFNEYDLVRIKEGLVPGKPTDVRIIESRNMYTGDLMYSLVVPLQIQSKDAYTFLYSEGARNYRQITSYLQGILHGLLHSQIDNNLITILNIKTNNTMGFVCRLSNLPPFSDNVYSHFIEPFEVLLDVTVSPSISEFEAPYKDREIEVSGEFYRNIGLIKENSFMDIFIKKYNFKDTAFIVQHGKEFAKIPAVLGELAINIIRKSENPKQVAVLFGEGTGLWNLIESQKNIELTEFSGIKVWQSIEYNAALELFKKDDCLSKYDIIIANPPSHRVVDFLLSNLKTKSETNHELFPTGESMVQRLARGTSLFIVRGGNRAEKNTLDFIADILVSNFDLCFQFSLAGEVTFVCGEVSQSKIIEETLSQTKELFESIYIQKMNMPNDFLCAYRSLTNYRPRYNGKKGKIVLITGPSGAGKDALASHLIEKYGNYFELPYQFISRQIRPGESVRKDVHHTNTEFFLKNGDELLAPSLFNNNLYAYSKKNVVAILDSGINCIINANYEGIEDIRTFSSSEGYDLCTVCILVNIEELRRNLINRQNNISSEEIQSRLYTVNQYLPEDKIFDVVIWNRNGQKEEFFNESVRWLKEREVIPEDSLETANYRTSISYSSSSAFISFPKFSNEKTKLTEKIVEVLEECNWNAGPYLDIGAGSGEITSRLVEHLVLDDVLVVEPSQLNINILKEKIRNLQFISNIPTQFRAIEQGWPEASRQIDKKFKLITMMHVYPKGKLENSIKSIHKVLDNDGIFLLVVHDSESQHIRIQEKLKQLIGGKVAQKALLNPNPTSDTFVKVAEDNGFKNVIEKTVLSHFKFKFPSEINDIFKSEYLVSSAAIKFFMDKYLDEYADCSEGLYKNSLINSISETLSANCKDQSGIDNDYNIASSHKIIVLKKI